MHLHANVALWQREEDGSYQAETNGWKLHVTWVPEAKAGLPAGEEGERPRGYVWKATGPHGKDVKSSESVEEIELARAAAERAAGVPEQPETSPPPLP